MTYFADDIDSATVELPDNQWARIKGALSTGDEQRIQDGFVEVSTVLQQDEEESRQNRADRRKRVRDGKLVESKGSDPVARIHPNNVLLLQVALVEWSFPRPINKKNIELLLPKYAGPILDETGVLYKETPFVGDPTDTGSES